MTTVACVFVRGHVPFTPEYVERLAAMVKRWMDRPYQFVCLTDHPEHVTNTVTRIVVPKPTFKGWWSKLELFNPDRQLSGRVLYLDLDTLIVGPLAPILDFPSRFALIPDAGTFQPKNGQQVVKRFNSSVMVWDAPSALTQRAWKAWTSEAMQRLWGDQDLLGETIPDAHTLPIEWFPRLSQIGHAEIPEEARVILAKKPKNHIAVQQYPWVKEVWQ